MNYWQFRYRFYQFALKQWLDNLKQISSAVVALFPLALPALLLMPLLALGVLADKNSAPQNYYFTLWGYLLLSYCWVNMQKEAINASDIIHYDALLPVSAPRRLTTDIGLILVAGHIFILGPAVILLSMLVSHFHEIVTGSPDVAIAQLSPVTALLVLSGYFCVSAIGKQRPWLSLGLIPLVAMPFSGTLSPNLCLLGCVIGIVAERIIPLPSMPLRHLPMGLWRLFLQQEIAEPKPTFLRSVVVLLLLILANIFINNVRPDVQFGASLFFVILLALVLATKLLEVRTIQQRFTTYLDTLPVPQMRVTVSAIAYSLMVISPFCIVMLVFGLFNAEHWCIFAAVFLSTQLGILITPKYYLLYPAFCTLSILLLYLL